MVECLEAVTCLVALWDDAGLFLKKKEFETSMLLAEKFLNSYEHLHKWALAKGRKLFNIVHKHHSFLHLVQSSQLLNPRITTTFRGEDFVGHISKMSHSVSFGVKATKLSQKLTPKYQVLCHLLQTRTDFELHSSKIFDWPCKRYSKINFGNGQKEQHWLSNQNLSSGSTSVALSVLCQKSSFEKRKPLQKAACVTLDLTKTWPQPPTVALVLFMFQRKNAWVGMVLGLFLFDFFLARLIDFGLSSGPSPWIDFELTFPPFFSFDSGIEYGVHRINYWYWFSFDILHIIQL